MLAHAVERSAFFNNIGTIDPDYFAIWKTITYNFESFGVVLRLIVSGHEDCAIEHYEIQIAGGEGLALMKNWRGQR